jgi:diadenosine tetraphosphate (Ap4A) HIT family hydrolase
MIKITKLSVSTLYLFKEQTYKGRCVVAYDNHINELFELSDEERTSFMKDVATAAKAIKEAFGADKMNLGAYSDKLPHLHFHIVPKYKDGYSWGGTFEMNPAANLKLSDAEYEEVITAIREKL